MNFKHPAGLEVLRELIKGADVLVENFVTGKLAKMGLGWEECQKLNPRLIYTSITGMTAISRVGKFDLDLWHEGYGQTGPYAKQAGYDVVIEAEAGLMHM